MSIPGKKNKNIFYWYTYSIQTYYINKYCIKMIKQIFTNKVNTYVFKIKKSNKFKQIWTGYLHNNNDQLTFFVELKKRRCITLSLVKFVLNIYKKLPS